MKVSELYEFIIKSGMSKDPRGEKFLKKKLMDEKKKYEKLSDEEKKEFDLEKLKNPYSDTRILYCDGDPDIKSIMVGIDIETSEILLAELLRRSGKKIDLLLSHHPSGRAYATFYEVMNMQADILNRFGVPINIAEAILEPRMKEVERKVMPVNHTRAVDVAKLLGIPFICVHTVSDNYVTDYLQKLFEKKKPALLDDLIKILKEIPEYKEAMLNSVGPKILVGSKERRAGKIFVDMTGGTEGSTEAFEKLATAGVGTIVGMHMSEDHYKNADKFHINVIIAGHISSDTLGLNLLLDDIEAKFGKIDVISCSGFKRIRRR